MSDDQQMYDDLPQEDPGDPSQDANSMLDWNFSDLADQLPAPGFDDASGLGGQGVAGEDNGAEMVHWNPALHADFTDPDSDGIPTEGNDRLPDSQQDDAPNPEDQFTPEEINEQFG